MSRPDPVVGPLGTPVDVTTWYLDQTDPARLRPGRPPAEPAVVVRAEVVSPEFSRFLYTAVGGGWHWTDRLDWTFRQWYAWLDRPGVETWVAWVRGTPAGYAELDAQPDGVVELAYFGLLPRFTGIGLGGHLLSGALRRAWTLADRWPDRPPTNRVWVHTCSLDGPAALPNYLSRGMTLYRTETSPAAGPVTAPPGPWPAAGPVTAPSGPWPAAGPTVRSGPPPD